MPRWLSEHSGYITGGVLIVAGFCACMIYGIAAGNATDPGWQVAIVALVSAGASLLVGTVAGFIFGIPRLFRKDQSDGDPPTISIADKDGNKVTVLYRGNANLEEISDWLTRILVGVGLVELRTIPGHLSSLGEYISPGLGGGSDAALFGVSTVLYFAFCGFLMGYVWTRLELPRALYRAEIILDRDDPVPAN